MNRAALRLGHPASIPRACLANFGGRTRSRATRSCGCAGHAALRAASVRRRFPTASGLLAALLGAPAAKAALRFSARQGATLICRRLANHRHHLNLTSRRNLLKTTASRRSSSFELKLRNGRVCFDAQIFISFLKMATPLASEGRVVLRARARRQNRTGAPTPLRTAFGLFDRFAFSGAWTNRIEAAMDVASKQKRKIL